MAEAVDPERSREKTSIVIRGRVDGRTKVTGVGSRMIPSTTMVRRSPTGSSSPAALKDCLQT